MKKRILKFQIDNEEKEEECYIDIPIDILSDMKFLETVQQWALWLLKKYPNLDGLPWLQKFLNEKIGDILA